MQTLICLVRHGVTEWNYDGRAQGRTDIPLSAEGLAQAGAVATRLAQEPWDAIYSSTLTRARQTAAAIAELTGHAVRQDARLVERHMGVTEGFTLYERRQRWPGANLMDLAGVETDEAMALRAMAALTEIAERHPGQRVICVSHGGLIKAFIDAIPNPAGESPLRFSVGNTAVARLLYADGQFSVQGPPDHSHLLVDDIDFTGEKGRVHFSGLKALAAMSGISEERLESVIMRASAVESAWAGGRLVGFARLFTDGVVAGYADLAVALPEYHQVIAALMRRLQVRFPNVTITQLPPPKLERASDP